MLKKTLLQADKGSKDGSVRLRVVVMSATLETDKLSTFLGHCPVFTIPGRTFPVTSRFGNAIGPKEVDSSRYVNEVGCL